ncbi:MULTISPECIES: hypothetical protein [unclassified Roseitalea]|uniref:hypothetical protein n=1 Tax=unclassified Roseitalea TaxID=2639107 RepID=UPI00273E476B|nr:MULTISPECIES: hypothetical protein [unclassified Roseitalea]
MGRLDERKGGHGRNGGGELHDCPRIYGVQTFEKAWFRDLWADCNRQMTKGPPADEDARETPQTAAMPLVGLDRLARLLPLLFGAQALGGAFAAALLLGPGVVGQLLPPLPTMSSW